MLHCPHCDRVSSSLICLDDDVVDDEDVAVVGKSMEARLRRMAAAAVADARD